jgi:hypothetical protein
LFISIDCLLSSLADSYTNDVVIKEVDLLQLQQGLANLKLNPRIFVLGRPNEQMSYAQRVQFFQKYEDLPDLVSKHDTIDQNISSSGRSVDVIILKDFKS